MSVWPKIVPLLLLVMAIGCSSGKTSSGEGPGITDELREVGELLSLYGGEFRRGPAKVGDLVRYEQGYPLGIQAIRTGAIVVVWGATMPGEGDTSGTDAVVAYEKKVPEEGGYVLLHNRTVKKMTAEEFASAKKFSKT